MSSCVTLFSFSVFDVHPFKKAGLASDFVEIDQVLHGIIAGRKRTALRGIREQTGTNIYFPSPMLGLTNYDNYGLNGVPTLRQYQSRIWITGETFGVRRAKEMLSNLMNTKVLRTSWMRLSAGLTRV